MRELSLKFIKDENGATAIEYGLIAGLFAVAIIGWFSNLADETKNILSCVGETVDDPDATGASC